MEELISIIVPVYNVEKYLKRCVESLVKQSYKNVEILLVDDGSTDSSGLICDELANKYNNVKVFHKKNGGLSDARNFGIKKSKGKILSFIDSDDYIDCDMIEFLYKELISANADVSMCSKYIDYENGNCVEVNNSKNKLVMTKEEALVKINSFVGFDMSFCDKIFKKELFKTIEFPYGKKCEDFCTMFRIFDKCSNNIVFNAVSKYHYFQREGSISRNPTMDKAYIDASKMQLDFFEKNYPELLFAAITMFVFANISYYNKCIKYSVECEKDELVNIKKNVKKNIKYVVNNKYIPFKKKLQALCFCCSSKLYKCIFRASIK